MVYLEKNKIKRKIRRVTSALLLLVTFILFGISYYFNIKLQVQVDDRDRLINKLTQRDSILNKIMEFEYDSISESTTYTYLSRGGKIIKYNSLAKELDESHELNIEIINTQIELSDLNKITKDKYNDLIGNYVDLHKNYSSISKKYNKLISEYNTNINDSNRDRKENYGIRDSLSSYKAIVDFVESKYFIKYDIQTVGNLKKIIVVSKKLDSALVLLPYFRDRLQKERNTWIITTRK